MGTEDSGRTDQFKGICNLGEENEDGDEEDGNKGFRRPGNYCL